MPYLIQYLLKFSLSIAVLYIFYQVFLRRLTFYSWNRWCLLAYTMIAFVVPFINISSLLDSGQLQTGNVIYFIPALEEITVASAAQSKGPAGQINIWSFAVPLIIAGALILTARLLVRLVSFFRILKNSTLISKNGVSIYEVKTPVIPFSFGNSIFLNPGQHNDKELEEIIRHEFVHVKQKHTIDIIWSEILCIINWYNPFAWLIRNAIRQNLEFIADENVLQNGVNKKEYQYLLLKVIGNNHFSIANQFNFSSLKKRIAMMNKIKSARVHLAKFAFLLPLLVVLLFAFRSSLPGGEKGSMTKPSSYLLQDTLWPVNKQGYYVNITDNKGHCTVLVRDKNGKQVKKVDLLKWNENPELYEAQFGEIEPPHQPEDCKLNSLCDEFEITDTKAIMHMRSGTTEVYDLTKPAERARFEKRFGTIVPAGISADEPMGVAVQEAHAPEVVFTPFPPASDNLMFYGNKTIIRGDEDVIVTITNKTTEKELEDLKAQLKAKGVEMTITRMNYDGNILRAISGELKANESTSNFSAVDFKNVKLAVVNRDGKYYFKIVVNDPNFC